MEVKSPSSSKSFYTDVGLALHYKLSMEDKDVNDPHGQIVYTPLLDGNRDEKILKVLPDYLTDEIMFAREQGTFLLREW
jgi:Chromosome segregation protein Csm1/Pcs1